MDSYVRQFQSALPNHTTFESVEHRYVHGALTSPSRVILDVERQLLPLAQRIEDARRKGRVVEEDLLPSLCAHKPEATITYQANH
jgi:hypothetical protein